MPEVVDLFIKWAREAIDDWDGTDNGDLLLPDGLSCPALDLRTLNVVAWAMGPPVLSRAGVFPEGRKS